MEPVAEPNELMERIRRAADRENAAQAATHGAGGSAGEARPPLSETLPRFMASALTIDLLDQAKHLLPSAHRKNEVPKNVPKLLRPLYRNQGGVNGVLLEVVERLVTANRQLAEQMAQLRDWSDAVGQDSLQNRAWATATDLRLEAFREERLLEIEVRLNRLEQPPGNGSPSLPAPSRPAASATGEPLSLEDRFSALTARLARLETDRASRAELADPLGVRPGRLTESEAPLARLQSPADSA